MGTERDQRKESQAPKSGVVFLWLLTWEREERSGARDGNRSSATSREGWRHTRGNSSSGEGSSKGARGKMPEEPARRGNNPDRVTATHHPLTSACFAQRHPGLHHWHDCPLATHCGGRCRGRHGQHRASTVERSWWVGLGWWWFVFFDCSFSVSAVSQSPPAPAHRPVPRTAAGLPCMLRAGAARSGGRAAQGSGAKRWGSRILIGRRVVRLFLTPRPLYSSSGVFVTSR